MICTAARGFLTQSDCGNPAATACSHCGRPMCAAHLSPGSGFTKCYDCAAMEQPAEGSETETEFDDQWAHGYRASYYSSTGYRPYDSQDRRAFDEQGAAAFDEDAESADFDAS